jgi:hypothetical protein
VRDPEQAVRIDGVPERPAAPRPFNDGARVDQDAVQVEQERFGADRQNRRTRRVTDVVAVGDTATLIAPKLGATRPPAQV